MADTGGRSLGNILVAGFGAFGVRWLPTTLYGFYAVIVVVLIIFTWVLYDECQKLVYVQLFTTANEKMLKEKKKMKLNKKIQSKRNLEQPEFSLNRHAMEVLQNKDAHVTANLGRSGVMEGDKGDHAPLGRKVSGDIMKNSELMSPAMRKKLGSFDPTRRSFKKTKTNEKIDWEYNVEKIGEVNEDIEDIEDDHIPIDIKDSPVTRENHGRQNDNKNLTLEVANPYGVIFC